MFSKNQEEHEVHLRQTLDTLQRHQLVAKPSKCEFFGTEFLFLGHIISAAGIKPNSAKVAAITKMPPPKDANKVCMFLDMISYVINFIAGCGELIAPLNKILDSKRPFYWTPVRDASFQALKTALVSAFVLKSLNSEAQYKIDTEASNSAICSVLRVNTRGGIFLPVAYKFWKLSTGPLNCLHLTPSHDTVLHGAGLQVHPVANIVVCHLVAVHPVA